MNIILEGFAGIQSQADFEAAGYSNVGQPSSASAVAGRFETSKGMRVSVPVLGGIAKALPEYSGNALFIGMAINIVESLQATSSQRFEVLFFRDINGILLFSLGTDEVGRPFLRVGNSVSIFTESRVVANQFQYWEIGYAASGTIELRQHGDETPLLSIVAPTGRIATIGYGQGNLSNTSGPVVYSDIYVNDATTEYANTFAGEIQLVNRPATLDSTPLQWTPSTGTEHFQLINEDPQNGDVDYISSNAADQIDRFGSSTPIGMPDSIMAISTRMVARKTNTEVQRIRSQIVSGGVVAEGEVKSLGQSYLFFDDSFSVNPNTLVPFTPAEAAAVLFGPRSVA